MNNIDKAIRLKKELDSLRPIKREDELRIMQKFRLDWNYHSNNIEGNSLTYGETKALILFGITASGKPLKDHFEITGHNEAITWVMDIVKQDRILTENFIRELHELILKESYVVDAITPDGQPTKKTITIGAYKTSPNSVKTKTGEIFRFATPEETPAKMKDLIDWYREKLNEDDIDPILLASEFHFKYVSIHPFDDGNGRTARILMNFILMQSGYPPVIIKTEDKENYYSTLRQADAGILEPFVNYIANNLIHSLELMIKGAKGESIEEPDDLDKEIAILDQRLKNVGKTIDVTKSENSLLNLYNNSITKLIKKYIKKGNKFDKYYVNSGFRLDVNNQTTPSSIENIIDSNRTRIKHNIKSLNCRWNYKAFKNIGFEEFNFSSEIIFNFELTRYIVADSRNIVSFEKLYSEQLKTEEIDELIRSEVRKHTEVIEEKIKQIEKKNSRV